MVAAWIATVTVLGLVLGFLVPGSECGQELFKNPGMEDPDIVGAYGYPWNYAMDRVNDSHSGKYAVKLSNRSEYWMAIGQAVTLKQNAMYEVSAFVKQLNNNSRMWQDYTFIGAYQWTDDTSDKTYWEYGRHAFGTPADGWFKVTGNFRTSSTPWVELRLYMQGPDPGIEFLVDDMSLQEVIELTTWKTEAAESIEKIRKGNFTVSISVADTFDPADIEVEIQLARHEFAFGSVISDEYILSPEYTIYQNLFYEFFNWGTVGSYKWKYNQGTREAPNYDRSVMATEELLKHGIKVRGHNMFWGVPGNSPDWAEHLAADELKQTIEERIGFMTNLTIGKLEHWDVNNELLHGQLYEEITQDPTYTQKIYRSVHEHDPDTKLFLNDYNVVSNGASTDDYVQQAKDFKAADCGLYGLGLQGHFYTNTEPDPTLIKKRLDALASVGLPMWITEFSLTNPDEDVRADWFESGLTAFFSHPAVDGIIFWGFWDREGTASDGALVNGNGYHINAAGKRYLELIKHQWSTNITTSLMEKLTVLEERGFYGDYDVIIRHQGKPIKLQHFTVAKNGSDTFVEIVVDGNGDEIVLPTSLPTTAPIEHVHHTTFNDEKILGHVMSSGGTDSLTCLTRYSDLSEVGDDKTADVMCDGDEVMTDCSMMTEDGLSFRDGEYFIVDNGQVTCRAVNAWRSEAPVRAAARCCSRQTLECTYMSAGPSGNGREDRIEVTCPDGTIATDCTSYTYFGKMDGAMSNLTDCFAQNDGTDYVFVYAACCQASGMTCQVRSDTSGLRQGDVAEVTCDASETLVGCSVFSEDGYTAGAVPNNNGTCAAVNGFDRFPGEDSVTAIAVCCT